MSFRNTFKRLEGHCAHGRASHAWIELLRLVESACRSVGRPFHALLAELEARFGFAHDDPARWPDVDTMRRAGAWLCDERTRVVARRARQAEAQRRRKAEGRRAVAPAELVSTEAAVRANAAAIPRVGFWGWRRRREEARPRPDPTMRRAGRSRG